MPIGLPEVLQTVVELIKSRDEEIRKNEKLTEIVKQLKEELDQQPSSIEGFSNARD